MGFVMRKNKRPNSLLCLQRGLLARALPAPRQEGGCLRRKRNSCTLRTRFCPMRSGRGCWQLPLIPLGQVSGSRQLALRLRRGCWDSSVSASSLSPGVAAQTRLRREPLVARWGCCPKAPTEQLPPGVHGSTHTSVNGPVFVGGAGGFGPVSGGGTEAEVRAAPHPSSSSPAPLSHLRVLVLWLYASTPRLGGPCPVPLQLSPANLPVAKGKGEWVNHGRVWVRDWDPAFPGPGLRLLGC